MRVSWKKVRENIPHRLRIRKQDYELFFTKDFKDGITLGEMRPDIKQIVIKVDQSDKDFVHTVFHEYIHAISEEYDVALTEKQVKALEKTLPDFYRFCDIVFGGIDVIQKK